MPGFLVPSKNADVAELADARGSGPRDRKVVGVQVPPSALHNASPLPPTLHGRSGYYWLELKTWTPGRGQVS